MWVPESSATRALALVLRILRPQAVAERNHDAASPTTIHNKTIFGAPQVARPANCARKGLAAIGGCAMDSKMIRPPLTMLAIASVITRGGTPNSATPSPLIVPTAAPAVPIKAATARRALSLP